MKRIGSVLGLVLALALALGTDAGLAQNRAPQADKGTPNQPPAGIAACTNMMQGAGMSEGGTRAMREFMQSDRAPQAMAGMMEMARRMGNGDVMLGMTRMMEMMGGMGGMMGGQGGGSMGGHSGAAPGRQPAR